MIKNDLDRQLSIEWKIFSAAEEAFRKAFNRLSVQCPYREKSLYRHDLKGRKYYDWKCIRKSEPFQWTCEQSTCPIFIKGLKLTGGGVS